MNAAQVTGVGLAIFNDRRPVYVKAYGFRDTDQHMPLSTSSVMTAASFTIRRECLDHVIVVNESPLVRVLSRYRAYYHHSRTHLALAKDSPHPRPIAPPTLGPVIAIPQVGGQHHRYRRAA
jgi:hypothetical protein